MIRTIFNLLYVGICAILMGVVYGIVRIYRICKEALSGDDKG